MILSLQGSIEVGCNNNLKVLFIVIDHLSITLPPFLCRSRSFLLSLSLDCLLSLFLSFLFYLSLSYLSFCLSIKFPLSHCLPFSRAFFLLFSHFLSFTYFSVSLFPSLFLSQRVSKCCLLNWTSMYLGGYLIRLGSTWFARELGNMIYTHPPRPANCTNFCLEGLLLFRSLSTDPRTLLCKRRIEDFHRAQIVKFVSFTGAFTGKYVVKSVKKTCKTVYSITKEKKQFD